MPAGLSACTEFPMLLAWRLWPCTLYSIVDKNLPGLPPVFKARYYVARAWGLRRRFLAIMKLYAFQGTARWATSGILQPEKAISLTPSHYWAATPADGPQSLIMEIRPQQNACLPDSLEKGHFFRPQAIRNLSTSSGTKACR